MCFDEDPDLGGDVLNRENFLIGDLTPTLPPVEFDDKTDFDDEEWILILIKIFLPFFTFAMISLILHSTGSEDTVFDPGIFIAKWPFSLLSPRTN